MNIMGGKESSDSETEMRRGIWSMWGSLQCQER